MVDLGLTKLALIGVVALIVIGPERLPKVARMAGTLYGRAQRYLAQVKSEVSQEMALEELRQIQQNMHETSESIKRDIAAATIAVKDRGVNPDLPLASPMELMQEHYAEHHARKVQNFRRKKLHRSSAIPAWYKQQQGYKTHVISAAARVARYRPGIKTTSSFFQ